MFEGNKNILNGKLGPLMLILLGGLLLVNPDFGSRAVATVLGWAVCILCGVVLAVTLLLRGRFSTVAGSALGLLAGMYILRNPLSLASVLGILLGIFLATQGFGALMDALVLRRGGGFWLLGAVWAAVILLLGLTLVFSPLTTSRLVMTLAGIVMIVCGVGRLRTHTKAERYMEPDRSNSRIIDADE